jgi:hypothetical protein
MAVSVLAMATGWFGVAPAITLRIAALTFIIGGGYKTRVRAHANAGDVRQLRRRFARALLIPTVWGLAFSSILISIIVALR